MPEESRIPDELVRRFVSPRAAQKWYESEPLPGFAGATAKQLVDRARGDELLDYIKAVDAGVFS
ncbi:DUF2384 domain-containing protein [Sphingomonas parva]|uniref:DUF2384 domain-containing protein n=1 Tax=Sphingomonas parva TaxID=2555898 RepID=A0A4Y8ZTH1_9SPHN|nr:DUF2384 domain-containing protein [Sphingomonas parva]